FFLGSNPEQDRVFQIAAEYFVSSNLKQLILFVMGTRGSGKSHIIKAIMDLFKQCGAS
ncbi:hypothetical protein BDN67DRAFT_876138, partial [Paxillus ammoniavirescens]